MWTRLLGVEKTVIERLEAEESDSGEGGPQDVLIVMHARPARGRWLRCGICDRWCANSSPRYGRSPALSQRAPVCPPRSDTAPAPGPAAI
ncbi:hypothetical protein ACFP51_37540 [Streptomyces pratens]|uniref:Uncharacterized protein n=1 Tax=Streptomyces pratens TaxID=887456 RepID=A0ABW1M3B4_9ACTN